MYASRPLVRTLMEHDLVDELRLTVFPVAVGAGERLAPSLARRSVDLTGLGDAFGATGPAAGTSG